jgi:glycosyltransferase involved in cell wall biosynthesis
LTLQSSYSNMNLMANILKPNNKPIRVLFLETGTKLYGGQRCILELIDYFQKKESIQCHLALPESAEYRAEIQLPKNNIHYLPLATDNFADSSLLAKSRRVASAVKWLCEKLAQLKPHIVHTNTNLAWQLAATCKCNIRFPLVAHKRDLVHRKSIVHFALHFSDMVICISPAVASGLPICYQHKIQIVPDGLPLDLDYLPKPISRARLLSKDHPSLSERKSLLIGIVGNLHPIKGQETVLAAAPKIFAKLPNAHILFIGDYYGSRKGIIEFREKMEKLTKASGHADKIHFLGYRQVFPDYIANLNLLLLPSKQEGLGRVILEALAYDKPVLATKSGGPEYLADLGAPINLYDIGNREELVSKIEKILNKEQYTHRKSEGHRFLRMHGLISHSGERIMDIYHLLLAKYHAKS